jgi:hypothetical protein
MKPKRMRRTESAVRPMHREKINVYTILIGKSERKRPLGT